VAKMSAANRQVQEEFLNWLLLDKRMKIAHRLPMTEADFAELKGTTTRTLRRWKAEPEFQTLLEQRKVAAAGKMLPNSAVAVGGGRAVRDARAKGKVSPPRPADPARDDPWDDPSAPAPEREYLKIKGVLASMASQGDRQALDLWMKYWGKEFVAAEQGRESILAAMSDDELLAEACVLLGERRVAGWLAERAAT
jgi:hypothetical protein